MSGGLFIVPPDPDDPDATTAPTAAQLSAAQPVPGVESVQPTPPLPELLSADDPQVRACTTGGVDHDYRTHVNSYFGKKRVYLRCVWCHAVTCGNADETDPCIEPYHHRVPHRTRLGVTWPIGGNRP